MSKLKDTLLYMAEQKENFKIGDKTFQIIEVVEAEQPQPDYSHLVGKWVKFTASSRCEEMGEIGKYYLCSGIEKRDNTPIINTGKNWTDRGWAEPEDVFDLTNPSDTNPDEVQKILVPKEIKISIDRQGMNLHFGNNQMLCVTPQCDSYSVCNSDRVRIQCELIKCERAELKKGDVAYRTNFANPNFSDLNKYSVIIDDTKHCYIKDNDSVYSSEFQFEHWYKVVRVQSPNK